MSRQRNSSDHKLSERKHNSNETKMRTKTSIRKASQLEEIQGAYPQRGNIHQVNQEGKIRLQKPITVDTGKELYPTVKTNPKVQAKFGELLDTNQYKGVNIALAAFSANPSQRVLLADGTGIGKTMQLLAIGWSRAKKTELPSLVVTKNENLLHTMREDAKQSDISSKRVHFTSYQALPHTLECNKYNCILFDEAHELANYEYTWLEQATKAGIVLASATAFSSPTNCVNLLSIVKQQAQEQTAEDLNLVKAEDESFSPKDGCNWEDVTNKLKTEKDKLMGKGTCIQRYLEFQGSALWEKVPGSSELNILSEHLKERIALEFREGHKVILYSSKKEELIQSLKEFSPVDFKKFKDSKGNLIILDPSKDAEGLRLHDKSGKFPRTIIITEPLDVEDLIQIQGRAHRRKSKSLSHIIGIYDPHNPKHSEDIDNLLAQSLFLTEQAEFCPALGDALVNNYKEIVDPDETLIQDLE